MKFGKKLHYERVASGALAEALPWIDYGCVSCPRRRLDEICRSLAFPSSGRPDGSNRRHFPSPLTPSRVRGVSALGSRRTNLSGAVAVADERVARSRPVV